MQDQVASLSHCELHYLGWRPFAGFISTGWKPVLRSIGKIFPAPPKKFFGICEKARVFRIVFVLGEIFPQYTLA
jgi:hypothetical protein